jgi:hypothetical protein
MLQRQGWWCPLPLERLRVESRSVEAGCGQHEVANGVSNGTPRQDVHSVESYITPPLSAALVALHGRRFTLPLKNLCGPRSPQNMITGSEMNTSRGL